MLILLRGLDEIVDLQLTKPAAEGEMLLRVELAEARRLSSDNRYSSISRLKVGLSLGVPKVRALFETTLFAGLRKAGMPEE